MNNINEKNTEVLEKEFKEKIPTQFSSPIDCIKFLMCFKDLFAKELGDLDHVTTFNTIANMSLRNLQTFCHMIKHFANDGDSDGAKGYFRDIITRNYSRS